MQKPQCDLCPKGNPAISFITDPEGNGRYFFNLVTQNDILEYKNGEMDFRPAYADNGCFVMGGDTVDRGPNDKAVVRALTAFKRNYPHRVFLILGNRDINKLRFFDELHKDPNNTDALVTPEDVSKKCYWHPRDPQGVWNSTHANSYVKWLGTAKATHSWMSILKWILVETMGCPLTFEYRRTELAQEQGKTPEQISDEQVYRDFYDSVDPANPDAWMLEYVRNGQICARLHATIFLHGSILKQSIRTMPYGCDTLKVDAPLTSWFHALNVWARNLVNEYIKDPKKAFSTGQIQPLLDYGLPETKPHDGLPKYHHGGKSILYSDWLDNGNCKAIDPEVYKMLAENGVDVLTGHKPHGDCPMVMVGACNPEMEAKYGHMPAIICADTSYSGNVGKVSAAAPRPMIVSDGRRSFSTVSIFDSYLEVKGRLANGNVHGFILEKSKRSRELTLIGKRLPDHSWTKTTTEGKLLCVRGHGFDLFTNQLPEKFCQHVVMSQAEKFPRTLGPLGKISLTNQGTKEKPEHVPPANILKFEVGAEKVTDDLLLQTWSKNPTQIRWLCASTSPVQQAFEKAHGAATGNVSLLAGVAGAQKKFAYIYPIAIEKAMEGVDYQHPLVVLFTSGGFVYLDEKGVVVEIVALQPGTSGGDQIWCDQPVPWSHEYTVQLHKQKRFQKNNIGGDYKWFAWIAPGEEMVNNEGEKKLLVDAINHAPFQPDQIVNANSEYVKNIPVYTTDGAWLFLAYDPSEPAPSAAAVAASVAFHVNKNFNIASAEASPGNKAPRFLTR